MGVAGAGKTTVATRVADALAASFLDADDAHPPANVEKMAAGIALTDADRRPWLGRLRDELAARERVVVTCSALKRRYRDVLRGVDGVVFVHLAIEPAEAERRLRDRRGHFMGPAMVASQFDALEPPADDETDVLVVDGTLPVGEIVETVRRSLSVRDRRGGTPP